MCYVVDVMNIWYLRRFINTDFEGKTLKWLVFTALAFAEIFTVGKTGNIVGTEYALFLER